jgi:hypothetical protein
MKILALTFLFVIFVACSEQQLTNNDTDKPEIISLTTDKSTIKFGGEEPAIITCNASGGNLEFTWEVDLGDIFPINSDNSQVRFSGSPCCIGKKLIKCTVTNDKGSDTKEIEIIILEP